MWRAAAQDKHGNMMASMRRGDEGELRGIPTIELQAELAGQYIRGFGGGWAGEKVKKYNGGARLGGEFIMNSCRMMYIMYMMMYMWGEHACTFWWLPTPGPPNHPCGAWPWPLLIYCYNCRSYDARAAN